MRQHDVHSIRKFYLTYLSGQKVAKQCGKSVWRSGATLRHYITPCSEEVKQRKRIVLVRCLLKLRCSRCCPEIPMTVLIRYVLLLLLVIITSRVLEITFCLNVIECLLPINIFIALFISEELTVTMWKIKDNKILAKSVCQQFSTISKHRLFLLRNVSCFRNEIKNNSCFVLKWFWTQTFEASEIKFWNSFVLSKL